MSKRPRKFQLFIVSVDFDTHRRPPPYYQLKKLLKRLGGVIRPTHQITLLLSPFGPVRIRDDIKTRVLLPGDRVYVGKIAKGSAWYNLKINSTKLKAILKTFAQGAEPDDEDEMVMAARKAIKGLLPWRDR